MIRSIQRRKLLVSFAVIMIVVLMGWGKTYAQDTKTDEATLFQQAVNYLLEGNIKQAHDIVEKGAEQFPQNPHWANLEKQLESFKDKDGQYPEHANSLNNQNPVVLGQGDQADLVRLPTSQMHVKAPAGWQKQSDGNEIEYSIEASPSALPKILVTLDDATGASTALEFCQKKQQQLMRNPKLTVTDPKEEIINGRKVAYMEFTGPTNRGFDLHMAWYQILIGQTIVTISSVNKDSESQKGLDALQEVVNSATFQ